MAILELILNQSFGGQLMVNRFHYIQTGTPAAVTPTFGLISATGFLEATGSPKAFAADTLARAIQVMQSEGVQFVSAYARALYSNTDFYETPYPSDVYGSSAGENFSPFVALGFRTSRVRTDIRRGTKRFGGIPEAVFTTGGILAAGSVGAANLLASYLDEVLSYDDEGNTLTYTPAVLGFQEYTTPSGKKAYKKQDTEAEQLAKSATGFTYQVYDTARSQVSRQYGRGR